MEAHFELVAVHHNQEGDTPMRKTNLFIIIAILGIFIITGAVIAAKLGPAADSGVLIKCDSAGNVSIPPLPKGKVLTVELYNDCAMTPVRKLTDTTSFKLEPCGGTNFTWGDSNSFQFHLITPNSPIPENMLVDCTWIDPRNNQPACKYLYDPRRGSGKVLMPGQ